MTDNDLAIFAQYVAREFYDDLVGYCKGVLGFTPDAWQIEALNSVRDHRRTAIRSGHGTGKTRLAAAVIHHFIATRAYPQIVCTANTQAQLISKLWRELAKVNDSAKNRDLFQWTATRFFLKAKPETWFAIAQPWTEGNSTAFAGTHEDNVLMVFDEASEIPPIIWDVASGAMSTKGARWLVLGNPTLNTGKFFECFGINMWNKGDSEDEGRWHAFTINAEDCPRVDRGYINEQLREAKGNREDDFYRIRVRGLPPLQAVHQFIPVDLFEKAAFNVVEPLRQAPRILGVDVAAFGDDKCAYTERKGGRATLRGTRRGQDTMATVGDVMKFRQEAIDQGEPYDAICVDIIGMGRGVYDRLKEQGVNEAIAVNVGEKARRDDCINLRAELWLLCKKWLAEAQISEEYRNDLIGIQYKFDSSGRLQMEKKDDMKKRGLPSPDLADSLCLTFYPLAKIKTSQRQTRPSPPLPAWAKKAGIR
jgi:hypothetical protein